MTFSEIYKKAEVSRLPVDPIAVAEALNIKVLNYKTVIDFFEIKKLELYSKYPLGFSFKDGNCFCVALNENSCGETRRRFTAAHEIAHCVLGHLEKENISPQDERAAERFAAELLAPLAVLHDCGVFGAEQIKTLCGISRQAAEIRAQQLLEREVRGFVLSDDERRVAEIFGEFIKSISFDKIDIYV